MAPSSDIVGRVRRVAQKRILFLPHALEQMSNPDRMISRHEVREVIFHGELVEDYPDDPRGHSCLLLGFGKEGRPVHVVCAPKDEYVAVITAYLPDPGLWESDWKTRKES